MAKRPSKRRPSAAQPTEGASDSKKRTYPYYLLRGCISLGGVVRDAGGDRIAVPKSVVAAGVKMQQSASAFAQLVASAKSYGIVDGYTTLSLTEAGREYYFPTTDRSTRIAELTFLAQPAAFQFIIDKFDGSKLPSPEHLGNLLGRTFGIPRSWSGRAAQIFTTNAEDLGVIDSDGTLRYDAVKHEAGMFHTIEEAVRRDAVSRGATPRPAAPHSAEEERHAADNFKAIENAQRHYASVPQSASAPNVDVWTHPSGIRVEVPEPLTIELWQRLNRHVQSLKPDTQPQEGEHVVVS
jgi:hypothetical protein